MNGMVQKTIEQRKAEALARQSVLAPQNVTTPSSQQLTRTQAQDVAISSRINRPSDKITAGATRSISQDLSNLQQFQKIQSAQDDLPNIGSLATNALTPEEFVLINAASGISPKASNDTARALERLQKSCNHQFSEITGRCSICNKSR